MSNEKPPRNQIEDDYIYSRRNMYKLMQDSEEVMDKLKELAIEAEHHSVFDVYFKAFKQVKEANMDFLNIQMKKQIIEQGGNPFEKLPSKTVSKSIEAPKTQDSQTMTTSDMLDIVDTEFEEVQDDEDPTNS